MTRLSFHLNMCGSLHLLKLNRSAKSPTYIAISTPQRELAEDRGHISAINKFKNLIYNQLQYHLFWVSALLSNVILSQILLCLMSINQILIPTNL